jgi:outer membrane protein assembly factor BamB
MKTLTWRQEPAIAWAASLWLAAAMTGASADERPVEGSSRTQLIASPEPGWPQWRGPRRDGISDETGLLRQWPEGGPQLLWKSSGIGNGYSAPIITGGRIYLAGDHGDDLRIHALDLEGRHVWQAKNGRAWARPHPGARASCAYSEGRVYHLNAHGRVVCLDANSGEELWAAELFERFGGRNITWALSEGLLVDGLRLIVTVGGTQALMAALDKKTGETIWTTEPLRLGTTDDPAHQRLAEPAGEIDNASYASPILFQLGARRHIVTCSLRHVFGVDADTGNLLWTRPLPTRYSVIGMTPVLVDDAIFITAPDGDGGSLFRIHDESGGVRIEKVWSTELDNCHGGVVRVGDALYGAWYRRKGWVRLDARTGAVRYELPDLAIGSVLYADGRLYCLSQEGEMALLEPTADAFDIAGRFNLISERKRDVWTHPVILDGRLYLRYHDTLFCYDIRDSSN